MLAFEMGFAGRWELFIVELGGKMSEDRGKDRVFLWLVHWCFGTKYHLLGIPWLLSFVDLNRLLP